MATYITKMFDRLDRICYDYYGSTDHREVETVIENNPGIEQYEFVLPMGIEIFLPDKPPVPEPTRVIRTVQLW